jgi:hypothetical protein
MLIFVAFLLMSCKEAVPSPTPSGQVTQLSATAEQIATDVPTPGLVITGMVLDEQGSGVENVQIYRSYSAYPGEVIATTNASGFYESDFYYIPGDEMVFVRAVKPGYTFTPENYFYRHYYGFEQGVFNFTAIRP